MNRQPTENYQHIPLQVQVLELRYIEEMRKRDEIIATLSQKISQQGELISVQAREIEQKDLLLSTYKAMLEKHLSTQPVRSTQQILSPNFSANSQSSSQSYYLGTSIPMTTVPAVMPLPETEELRATHYAPFQPDTEISSQTIELPTHTTYPDMPEAFDMPEPEIPAFAASFDMPQTFDMLETPEIQPVSLPELNTERRQTFISPPIHTAAGPVLTEYNPMRLTDENIQKELAGLQNVEKMNLQYDPDHPKNGLLVIKNNFLHLVLGTGSRTDSLTKPCYYGDEEKKNQPISIKDINLAPDGTLAVYKHIVKNTVGRKMLRYCVFSNGKACPFDTDKYLEKSSKNTVLTPIIVSEDEVKASFSAIRIESTEKLVWKKEINTDSDGLLYFVPTHKNAAKRYFYHSGVNEKPEPLQAHEVDKTPNGTPAIYKHSPTDRGTRSVQWQYAVFMNKDLMKVILRTKSEYMRVILPNLNLRKLKVLPITSKEMSPLSASSQDPVLTQHGRRRLSEQEIQAALGETAQKLNLKNDLAHPQNGLLVIKNNLLHLIREEGKGKTRPRVCYYGRPKNTDQPVHVDDNQFVHIEHIDEAPDGTLAVYKYSPSEGTRRQQWRHCVFRYGQPCLIGTKIPQSSNTNTSQSSHTSPDPAPAPACNSLTQNIEATASAHLEAAPATQLENPSDFLEPFHDCSTPKSLWDTSHVLFSPNRGNSPQLSLNLEEPNFPENHADNVNPVNGHSGKRAKQSHGPK